MKKFKSVTKNVLSFIKRIVLFIINFIKKAIISFDNFLATNGKSLIFLVAFSIVVNIFLEASLRKSFIDATKLIFTDPAVFFLGALIVLATYSTIYIFKRRFFVFTFFTILWSVVTYVSYYLMCQRTTPFNSSDFRVLKTTFDIITLYFTYFEIFLLLLLIVAFLALLVFIFIKCKKSKGIFSLSSFTTLIIFSVTLLCVFLNTKYVIAADRFDNLPNKYREHGFTFCFLYSVIDNGIDRPKNYSKGDFDEFRKKTNDTILTAKPEIEIKNKDELLIENIYNKVIANYKVMPDYDFLDFSKEASEELISRIQNGYSKLDNLEVSTTPGTTTVDNAFDQPNIIFLQLESFYDVNNIEGYEYSSSPHPIYSMLKEQLPGGKLSVPSIGAGTANTEFEVLTGMDVSFFGIAEYPYLSVLQSSTCESMAFNAKEYGYKAHAIHNHKGTFYDRNNVYPRLGFDTFSSIENMPDITRNQRKWGKDAMLINPILDTLKSTEGKDLIFSVSVQPHGRYPSASTYKRLLLGQEPKIAVSGNDDNPENAGFTYYVNQLNEVDTFIGSLILELSFISEPTILVLYGDHLPAFSVQKYWQLKEGNCYQTDYMIWNNCGIDFSDAKDLHTYQLSSYVFKKVGIGCGDFNKLNQLYIDEDVSEYAHLRHIYQYATLYDNALKKQGSDIVIPTYEKAETDFGIYKTSVTGIYTIESTTYITGTNFNEFSTITINGQTIDTELLSTTVLSTNTNLSGGDVIGVVQLAVNHAILGQSTNTMLYCDSMIIPEEQYQKYTDLIVPKPEEIEDPDQGVIEDATLEFETGADEINMIQEDISKVADSDSDESDVHNAPPSPFTIEGDIIPEEELHLLS